MDTSAKTNFSEITKCLVSSDFSKQLVFLYLILPYSFRSENQAVLEMEEVKFL